MLAVLAAGLLMLTNSWARQNSGFDQLDLLIDVRHELMRNYVEEPDAEAMTRFCRSLFGLTLASEEQVAAALEEQLHPQIDDRGAALPWSLLYAVAEKR